MNVLFEAAREVCSFMSERGWSYCIIGGLAVQRWGEPRTTLDVDFTLMTGWGNEAPYVTALLERFEGRIPDAGPFALARRVLLLRSSNGCDVDVALGALPFEAEMLRRAVTIQVAPDLTVPFCTPEDLFVMKAFAGRSRDWADAESIHARQAELDSRYIIEHLRDLCEMKDAPENFERARKLLEVPR